MGVHLIVIKGKKSTKQAITILNIYTPHLGAPSFIKEASLHLFNPTGQRQHRDSGNFGILVS